MAKNGATILATGSNRQRDKMIKVLY